MSMAFIPMHWYLVMAEMESLNGWLDAIMGTREQAQGITECRANGMSDTYGHVDFSTQSKAAL